GHLRAVLLGGHRAPVRDLAGLPRGPARSDRVAAVRMMWRAFVDTLGSAARSLGAHKLRSALTLLGIVIGVLTVVAMASAIEGLRRKINDDLAELGSGVFQVQRFPFGFEDDDRPRFEKRKHLTMTHVSLLREHCTECLRVGGEAWGAIGQM